MQPCVFTDGLGHLPWPAVLDWAAARGARTLEIASGNWSTAPHCPLDRLLDDRGSRRRWHDAIRDRGLRIAALNCNGNPLHPDPHIWRTTQDTLFATIRLAAALGVPLVSTMCGCPGTPDPGRHPVFVPHPWPPEWAELHRWQWEDVALPFWTHAAQFAAEHEVRIALELFPGQLAHNPRTLLRLRHAAGPSLGATLDPSHLFAQGIDPVQVARALTDPVSTTPPGALLHVHIKDARLRPDQLARNGPWSAAPLDQPDRRPWTYAVAGRAHHRSWWRTFCETLAELRYRGALSVEHEDPEVGPEEGIAEALAMLTEITA